MEHIFCHLCRLGVPDTRSTMKMGTEVENPVSSPSELKTQLLWALKAIVPIYDGKNENIVWKGACRRTIGIAAPL